MYFPDGQNIKWHGVNPDEPDWSDSSRLLAYTITKKGDHNWQRPGLYVAWNTSHRSITVNLPEWAGSSWRLVADTSKVAEQPPKHPPICQTDLPSAFLSDNTSNSELSRCR